MPVVQNKLIKEIVYCIEEKAGYKLNKIVFGDNTYAMEKAVECKSQFTVGLNMDYEVTHPGKGEKPDWIKCLGVHSEHIVMDKKDYLIMAQHSMSCAKDICIANNRFSEDPITIDKVIEVAKQLAAGTLDIAKTLIGKHV